jgi:hypothetical protein
LPDFAKVVQQPVCFRSQCPADAAELAQGLGGCLPFGQPIPDPIECELQKRERAGPPNRLLHQELDGGLIERVGHASAPGRSHRREQDCFLQLGLDHRRHQLAACGNRRI